jgi:hypothetical protein
MASFIDLRLVSQELSLYGKSAVVPFGKSDALGSGYQRSEKSRSLQQFSLLSGDFDYCGGIVTQPLPGAARYRFYPAVHPRSKPPEQVDSASVLHVIELGGNHQKIDVAPGMSMTGNLRTEDNCMIDCDAVLADSVNVRHYRCQNRLFKHFITSVIRIR